jgi:D-aspartate ligase
MVPVVVVNASLNALGVIRSVARGGMPIYLVTPTRRDPAAWSRFCRCERVRSLDGHDLIAGLISLSRRIGQRPVLILTSDAEVETISAFREELAPFFRVSLPSKEMVRTLADKTLFQRFAEAEGFPIPRAIVVSDTSSLSLLRTLTLPVVIKPGDKTLVLDGRVERAVRADTLEHANTAAGRMLKCAQRLVVQEWIDGADSDIYFTLFTRDSSSGATTIFSGRKLVCDPPAVGTTAICIAAPEAAAELEAISTQFISRTGYQGIGSLEFKRSRESGRIMIIEPTVGRTDWQEEVATLCGINIPLITYWGELGVPMPNVASQTGQVAWRSSMRHRIPPDSLPPGARTIDGYFRLSDPLPGLYHYVIKEFVERLYCKTRRLLGDSGRALPSARKQPALRSNKL